MSHERYNGNRSKSLTVDLGRPRPDREAERAFKALSEEQRRKVKVFEGIPITIGQARRDCQALANYYGRPVAITNARGRAFAYAEPNGVRDPNHFIRAS